MAEAYELIEILISSVFLKLNRVTLSDSRITSLLASLDAMVTPPDARYEVEVNRVKRAEQRAVKRREEETKVRARDESTPRSMRVPYSAGSGPHRC